MTIYAVKSTHGKHHITYLQAWDAEYGTACIGSIKLAMTFATKEEADAAAVRAAAECKTLDGKVATFFNWSVVPLTGDREITDTERLDWLLVKHPEFEDDHLRLWLGSNSAQDAGFDTGSGHYIAYGSTAREQIDNAINNRLIYID